MEQYPLPKPDELFATLAKGRIFSKLDLSQAYLLFLLGDASIPYVAINIHQGLYTFTRLPFGVASAPAIIQKLMDKVLLGLEGVLCYIDDILVCGVDEANHFQFLEEVFARLERHGFRLKQEKCQFLLQKLNIWVPKLRVMALTTPYQDWYHCQGPSSKEHTAVTVFLELTDHYGKFIPNLSTLLQLLNMLLQAGTKWSWSSNCANAFQEAKKQLASARVLTHYNPTLPIKLATDASAYGVGGGYIAHNARWNGKANSLCLTHAKFKRNELRSIGKKSLVFRIRSKEIPSLSLWTEIYFTHGPSTADNYFQSKERYPVTSSSSFTALGSTAFSLRLQHRL